LDAGSGMAAPGALTQGAALASEGLDTKAHTVSQGKFKKSKLLLRAEKEYGSWDKKKDFEKFMADRMPHLTKGEVRSIGQAIALSKSVKSEMKLASLNKEYMHSYIEKSKKK
jgi:hypothetical protein